MRDEGLTENIVARLKRIEGQVRGIQRMVEKGKYCVDIINQVSAARRALDQVGLKLMHRHINNCVSNAIRSDGGKTIIEELMGTMNHFIR